MRARLPLLFTFLLAAGLAVAQIATESFNDYDAGSALAGLDGGTSWGDGAWTQLSDADGYVVAEGGLAAPGLARQTSGPHLTIDKPAGADVRYVRPLGQRYADEAGAVYYLGSFQRHEGAGGSYVMFADSDTYGAGGPTGQLIMFGKNPDQAVFGTSRPPATNQMGSVATTAGSFVVGVVAMSGDAANEDIYLFVDPDLTAATLDTTEADVAVYNINLNDGFDAIGLKATGPAVVSRFDDIRLGTSYADVVPADLSEAEGGVAVAATEAFAYAAGESLVGQAGGAGWDGAWSIGAGTATDSSEVVDAGLVLTGLEAQSAAPAARIISTGANQRHQRLFAEPITPAGGAVWFSFQLGVDNLQNGVANLTLVNTDTAGGRAFERAFIGKQFGNNNLFVNGAGVRGAPYQTGRQFVEGEGVWVVSQLVPNPDDSTAWTLNTWVDPDPAAAPAMGSADASAPLTEDTFDGIWLKVEGGQGLTATFDDVLFGGTFADVVPGDLTPVDLPDDPATALERFDYDAGAALAGLDGGEGWGGAWAASDGVAVAEGSLESGRLDAAANHLTLEATDQMATRPLLAAFGAEGLDSGSVYVGFLHRQPAVDIGAFARVEFVSTGAAADDDDDVTLASIGSQAGSAGYAFDYAGGAATATAAGDLAQTAWVVLRFDLDGTDAADAVYAWVDPPADALPTDASAAFSATDLDGAAGLDAIRLVTGGTGNVDLDVDEIRVGFSYGDVSTGFVNEDEDLVAGEPFNYDPDQSLLGLGGVNASWGGTWELGSGAGSLANNAVTVLDGSLAADGVETSGNRVEISYTEAGQNIRLQRPLSSPITVADGNEYWISYIRNTTQADAFANVSFLMLMSDPGVYPNGGEAFGIGRPFDEAAGNLGFRFPQGPAITVPADESEIIADVGQHLMVAQIISRPDEETDQFFLWIDPPAGSAPDTADAYLSSENAHLRDATIDAVRIKTEGGPGPFVTEWDEIRVATTFASSLGVISSLLEPDVADLEGVRAFPNPVGDRLTVEWVGEADGAAQVRVFDRQGRLVATPLAGERAAGLQRVDWELAPGTADGIYFLQIAHGERASTRRVFVRR